MFPRSRTKQLFSVALILNLVLLGGFVGLYYLLQNRAQAANELRKEVAQKRKAKEYEATRSQLVESTAEERSAVDSLFVRPDGSASFIATIEGLARDAGADLEINNVSVKSLGNESDNAAANFFENLHLDTQVTGTWNQATHYLQLLEALPKEVRIKNVSVKQGGGFGDDDSVQSWTVSVTVVARKLTQQ